jgi:ATP-dependent helicase Lhr and Lhr-like helicase
VNAFERLHPSIQYHIVNSLGWPNLRPTQLDSIDLLLKGHDALVLAPTAGGKTEAAIFPVLSRMLSEHWSGLSVLYICPLRALLNNVEPRLSHYAALVGRSVAVWHGGIRAGTKNLSLKSPPDILLTTPESIESILISTRVDHVAFFCALRVVVVDKAHAFASDDRGWHLLALLERLDRLAGHHLQRVGLSATIGNPDAVAAWLAQAPAACVIGASSRIADGDVTIDYVGSIENAAQVLAQLFFGEKRLVFCDSRARVESLALQLREHGLRTFVCHSSLSDEERREAERAFAESSDCIIVATSTLELGIDVGDLDRVIQIDAPSSVSSFYSEWVAPVGEQLRIVIVFFLQPPTKRY